MEVPSAFRHFAARVACVYEETRMSNRPGTGGNFVQTIQAWREYQPDTKLSVELTIEGKEEGWGMRGKLMG